MSESDYAGKTCFIYARRSSEKDKITSISIESQLEELRRDCKRRGLVIEKEFYETKSSYRPGIRYVFNEMLDEIKKRNLNEAGGKVDYLCVYTISRLARNREEALILGSMLEHDVIRIIAVNDGFQGTGDNQENKRVIDAWNEAIYDSKRKETAAKRDMDKTYRSGRLARTPPYGYRLNRRKGDIILDDRGRASECVKEMFRRYSTGSHTYESLAQELNSEGYRKTKRKGGIEDLALLTPKDVEGVLIKPFYWGKVEVEYRNFNPEQRRYFNIPDKQNVLVKDYSEHFFPEGQPGQYERLIDYNTFKRVQDIRAGKKMSGKRKTKNEEKYVWKSILKCPCRAEPKKKEFTPEEVAKLHSFTAETKKDKYIHYRCSNNLGSCDNRSISGLDLGEVINAGIIRKIQFGEAELEVMKGLIQRRLKAINDWRQDNVGQLRQQQVALKREINKCFEAIGSPENDVDTKNYFRDKKEKLTEEFNEIDRQISVVPDLAKENIDKVEERFECVKNLSRGFFGLPPEKQKRIASAVFEYIVLKDKKVLDFRLKPLFQSLFQAKKVLTQSLRLSQNAQVTSNSCSSLEQKKTALSGGDSTDWQPRSESN